MKPQVALHVFDEWRHRVLLQRPRRSAIEDGSADE